LGEKGRKNIILSEPSPGYRKEKKRNQKNKKLSLL